MVNNNNLNLTKEKEVDADSSTETSIISSLKKKKWILKNFTNKALTNCNMEILQEVKLYRSKTIG